LGSIDGLLHVTDISWSRINHPSEILAIGQTVKVQVIKYNQETKRVSLGMKQLEENPWSDIEARYPRGSKVKGKVTNVADYGAFIEIGEGVEGLVHVSEITWAKNNPNPKKILNVG
jgi:small subunit ribosomal protein S1